MWKRLSQNASKDVAETGRSPCDPGDGQAPVRAPAILHRSAALVEYDAESRTFLLEDGISLGALFELTPAGTEARTPEFMTQLRDAIQTALTDAIRKRMMPLGAAGLGAGRTEPAWISERDRGLPATECEEDAIHPALPVMFSQHLARDYPALVV